MPLFVRTSKGVTLTKAGLVFLPEARRTVAQAEKAIATVKAAQVAETGQFLVGYTTVFDRSEIPDVWDALRRSFPQCNIQTLGKHSIGLVPDVKKGIIDAAFITLHTEVPGLKTESIFDEPLVVALPAQHPLARRRTLTFDDLKSERLFWFDRRLNPGYYDHCLAYFKHIGFKPDMLPEPADHHMLLGAIAEGQGYAMMSKSLQKIKRRGVVFRPMQYEGPALSMGMAVAYSSHNTSPVLHRFLDLIRAARKSSSQ